MNTKNISAVNILYKLAWEQINNTVCVKMLKIVLNFFALNTLLSQKTLINHNTKKYFEGLSLFWNFTLLCVPFNYI